MSYDADLEARIDQATGAWGVVLGKKKVFSGLAYFINGNMCFAIRGNEILLRIDEARAVKLATQPDIQEAVMGPRRMKNWLQVGGETIGDELRLLGVLTIGRDYALRLPPK